MTIPLRPSTVVACASVKTSAEDTDTGGCTQMSKTKIFDPLGFRAHFALRWGEFLRANYRNPEEVAVNFGVRYQTALNWWQGLNRPSGDVVAAAFLEHPEAMREHLEAAE